MLVFWLQYADFVESTAAERAHQVQAARASLLDRLKLAGDVANMLSLIPELADAVDVRDQGRIADYALPLVEHTDLDLVTVYAPDGKVLARGDQPALFGGDDELSGWVRNAASRLVRGQRLPTVHRWGDAAVLISCVPVTTLNAPIGAVVVAGFRIEGAFLQGLRERSGVDVETALKSRTIAASLPAYRLSAPTLERVAVPLDDVIAPAAGFSFRVLVDDSADRERFWSRLTAVLAVLVTVSLAVVVGSAFGILTTITGPLRAMARALVRLAAGEAAVPIPYRDRADEIGAMARAAEVFQGSMAQTAALGAARERERLAKEKAENEAAVLAESGRRLRAVFTASPVPLMLCRGEPLRVVLANDAALELFGENEADLGRHAVFDMLAEPLLRDRLLTRFSERGAVNDVDAEWCRPDGSRFWGLVSMRLVELDDKPALLLGVGDITVRKTAETEMRAAKEAAERAYAELKRTQESLIQAEKMASLSMLVAGVAHEINTPVGIGLTSASFLAEKTVGIRRAMADGTMRRTEFTAYMDTVNEAAGLLVSNMNRAHDLIQSFKQVAVDQTSAERRRFDMKGYLDEVLTSISPQLRKAGHRASVHCPVPVEVDTYPGALAQIITNLVVNSVTHAWNAGVAGRIEIAVAEQGDHVVVTYADDGRGIAAHHRSRIFEPFFTTRRGSGGTGLGLHIVYNLATRSLKGDISVGGDADGVAPGARFTLRFPKVAPREEP